jgi:predicted ribonuclease YlaK
VEGSHRQGEESRPNKQKYHSTILMPAKTRKKTIKRQPINSDLMVKVEPLTDNQQRIFDAWKKGKHMFIYGAAGTGKTFCALYNALYDCLSSTPAYSNVYLVRSLVATREIGFLPGDHDDKSSLYQIPYKNMVKYMFEMPNDNEFELLYGALKNQETIKFWSTSFLRGVTLDNAVIIIDEMQNLNFHELDSIITRVGENSRIIFCGDAMQSDLTRTNEKNGIHDFMRILEMMPDDFEMIEMNVDDICRSGLVRNYLIAKNGAGFTSL